MKKNLILHIRHENKYNMLIVCCIYYILNVVKNIKCVKDILKNMFGEQQYNNLAKKSKIS